MKQYQFEVTFVNEDGETVVVQVEDRHSFEAVQLAGAFGKSVISVVNLDM